MKKLFSAIAALLLFATTSFAGKYDVEGYVKDYYTMQPMANVLIYVEFKWMDTNNQWQSTVVHNNSTAYGYYYCVMQQPDNIKPGTIVYANLYDVAPWLPEDGYPMNLGWWICGSFPSSPSFHTIYLINGGM